MRVVILGAGFGGLEVAHGLDALAASGAADVTLVDRGPAFQMGFAMQWAFDGRRGPEGGRRAYPPRGAPHVKFVAGEVRSIDTNGRLVDVSGKQRPYDRLVVALGTELAMDAVEGLADGARNLYAMESVLRFREDLARVQSGTVVVAITSTPYKCPPAPFEYALLIDEALSKRGVRDACRVVVTSPEPQPMTVAGPEVGRQVEEMMAERGIEFKPRHKVARVDAGAGRLHFEGGDPLDFALLGAVPKHRAPPVVRAAGLSDESGFVPVELGTFRTKADGVFAIGDAAGLRLPAGSHHPKAGVFAELQGAAVARIIHAELGGPPVAPYLGHGVCFVDVGGGQAAMADANLLAPGGPRFRLDPPGPASLDAKRQFEAERLDRWFGPA